MAKRKKTPRRRPSFAEVYPELVPQWHRPKNGALRPSDISFGCGQRVWWQCPHGHEWQAAPCNRRKSGCPYCAGQKVDPTRSLAAVRPDLAAQWSDQNTFSPAEVLACSGRRARWRCPKGHEWVTTARHRVEGTGCPYCAGKHPLPETSFAALASPDLLAEWHPDNLHRPDQYLPHSGRKVTWRCRRGHTWEATVHHRMVGQGCPKCADRFHTSFPEQALFYYLRRAFPDAISRHSHSEIGEIDIYLPGLPLAVEYDGPHHHTQAAVRRDRRKNTALAAAGVPVVRVRIPGLPDVSGPGVIIVHMERPGAWDTLQACIAAVAVAIVSAAGVTQGAAPGVTTRPTVEAAVEAAAGMAPELTAPQAEAAQALAGANPYVDRFAIRAQMEELELERSLAHLHPAVAAEWHPDKNGQVRPEHLPAGSNWPVWWRCDRGHEWEAPPARRTGAGSGCPYCCGNLPTPETCLATRFPAVAAQWHPTRNGTLTASDVTARSPRPFWWRCQYGHEWRTTVGSRTGGPDGARGTGCPFCAGKYATPDSSLESASPHLTAEWDRERNGSRTPQSVRPGSGRPTWWLCPQGHSYQSSPAARRRGRGCPFCAGKRACSENSLANTHREIAVSWHPTANGSRTPDQFVAGSHERITWRCAQGHEWAAMIRNRTRGAGCPYCAGQRISPERSLAARNPALAAQWHPERNGDLSPWDVMPNSNRKAWWLCSFGHTWHAVISPRHSRGVGCPVCSGRVPSHERSLEVQYPVVATQWHAERNGQRTPAETAPQSSYKAWWRCSQGHEWQAVVASRTVGGCGCPLCSGRQASSETSVAALLPAVAADWHPERNGLAPSNVTPGSNKVVWWRCRQGHELQASVKSRVRAGRCPLCRQESKAAGN